MNRTKIEKLIRLVRENALQIVADRQFVHASVILRRNTVISVGYNQRRTHPLAKEYGYRDEFVHSELDALISVPRNQRHNLSLVNFRFNRQGDLRMSKPCEKCFPWVVELFKEVYYSDPTGNIVKIVY